tara:strand:+ start:1369 stop:1491 length:123 start_codon:yes stop_codon:yes gene_type:complete
MRFLWQRMNVKRQIYAVGFSAYIAWSAQLNNMLALDASSG